MGDSHHTVDLALDLDPALQGVIVAIVLTVVAEEIGEIEEIEEIGEIEEIEETGEDDLLRPVMTAIAGTEVTETTGTDVEFLQDAKVIFISIAWLRRENG